MTCGPHGLAVVPRQPIAANILDLLDFGLDKSRSPPHYFVYQPWVLRNKYRKTPSLLRSTSTMLSKTILPLVSLLLLTPATSGEYIQLPQFTAATESPRCQLTSSVTYHDEYGPLFAENRYTCSFPSSPSRFYKNSPKPFRVPAPYSHPAGDRASDDRIGRTGSVITDQVDYDQQIQASSSKHTITEYGCTPLEGGTLLSRDKYSNLFWAMGQLTNQSCLEPGEAAEYVDFRRDWTADWRFTNVNRGEARVCDWYSELANVAKALHYFCFHTLGRPSDDEFSGGEEILAFGKDRDERQQWCMRYSKKGWKSAEFEEKCLGI